MKMNKIFTVIGWLLIVGGLLGAALTYSVVNSQDFVVALLARVVEEPFEQRSQLALLSAVLVALCGCLIGAIYLGLAEVLRRGQGAAHRPGEVAVGNGN